MTDIKKLVQDKDKAIALWFVKFLVKLIIDMLRESADGIIGDIAGAFGSHPDFSVQDKINELVDAVNRLREEVATSYELLKFEAVDDQMAPALTAWKLLQADPSPRLRADGTVDEDYAEQQLFACDTSLQSLGPELSDDPLQNKHWLGDFHLMQDIFYSRVPWFGVGSGEYDEDSTLETQPPVTAGFHFVSPTELAPGSAEGWLTPKPSEDDQALVFNHIYVLPNFLEALSIYLAVGGILLPGFPKGREALLRSYAMFLANVHDLITSDGIVLLSPPSPMEIYSIYNTRYQRDDLGYVVGVDHDGYLAGGAWREYSRFQPYGAVERFAGLEAILPYPRIAYSPADFVPMNATEYESDRTLPRWKVQKLSSDWLRLFYGKYRVRSVACAKVLYTELGLRDVRTAVNGLCALVGDPPRFVGRVYDEWSLREAFLALNDPNLPLSARSLVEFMRTAPPADGNALVSLRGILVGDVAKQLAL